MSRWCSVELVIIPYFTLSSQERVCRESLVSRSLSCETPSRLSLKQKLTRARIRIGLMIIGGSLPKYIKTVNSRVNVETVALIPTHVARKLVFSPVYPDKTLYRYDRRCRVFKIRKELTSQTHLQ